MATVPHEQLATEHRSEPAAPRPGPDAALLKLFVAQRDEAAFRTLVERYAALVWGVCFRVLRDPHDAEDALQATFMVLASKAATLRTDAPLGPWLYGTAYRISLRSLAARARRKTEPLPVDAATADDALAEIWRCHCRRALDDELQTLPARLRDPLVLHYFAGQTNGEVAAALGLSVRTVEGRQRRGKALLKRRLAARGVGLSLAVAAAATTPPLSAAALEFAATAGTTFLSGTAGVRLATQATALAQEEMAAMATSWISTVGGGAAVATISAALAVGAWAATGSEAEPSSGFAAPTVVAAEATATANAAGDADVPLDADLSSPAEPYGGEAADANPFAAASSAGSGEMGMMANPPTDNDPFAKKQAVPAPFDPTPQPASPGERRIREALTHSLQTPLQYIETPLNQIASQLSDEYGIPIQFDGPALDSIAISPDVEVSLDVHDLPLKSALRLLLRQVTDLDYLVRDDVLLITTCDEADNWMETHVYDLGSLVERGDYDVAELQQMIRSCIAPEAWAKEAVRDGKPLYQPGGEISILGAQRLVIRQTQAGHEEIVALLKELDRRTAP